jgi:hypothetical protein
MSRYRTRAQSTFYCVGCQTEHRTSVPMFTGPADGEGRKMYCPASHPDQPKQAESTVFAGLRHYADAKGYAITVKEKTYIHHGLEADADTSRYDYMLAVGKSMIVGDEMGMDEFLRKYTIPITTEWMPLAVQYVTINPGMVIRAVGGMLDYSIYHCGDHTVIMLPDCDRGGEKAWVTKDGQRMVLVSNC